MSKILAFKNEELQQKLGWAKEQEVVEDVGAILDHINKLTPVWKERDDLESDPTYRQPIVYFRIASSNDSVLLYKRKGGGESRLDGKYSIGFGGHVDYEDQSKTNVETLINSAQREMREELPGLKGSVEDLRFDGVSWSSKTEVDKVHVAIFMTLVTELEPHEIGLTEGTLIGFIPKLTLANLLITQGINLENWSVELVANY